MHTIPDKHHPSNYQEVLHTALEEGSRRVVAEVIGGLHPAQMADALEALPRELRPDLWREVPAAVKGEVLLDTETTDMFAPVLSSARRWAVWLSINLVNAFVAAWVIGLFEESLDKIVALAVLMPVIVSMGGVAGSQTLTLVTRGIALGQVGKKQCLAPVVERAWGRGVEWRCRGCGGCRGSRFLVWR